MLPNLSKQNIYLATISIFVICTYLMSSFFSIEFEKAVVPQGDPFTYSIGFFKLVNSSQEGVFNYFYNLFRVISPYAPNWYWLINFLTVLLSPFLVADTFSISVVNFILFTLASFSIFKFVRGFETSLEVSAVCALLIWAFPVNYGFATYESIPVLGLDAAFAGVYTLALFTTLIFLQNPKNTSSAIYAGAMVGVSVWGRGNSAPTIALILFAPLIWKFFEEKVYNDKLLFKNALIFIVVSLTFAFYFYYSNFAGLYGYYGNHTSFYERHVWNLGDAKKWLLNIPGFLFWRHQDSSITIFLSFFCHAIFGFLTVFPFFSNNLDYKNKSFIKMLAFTGGSIYFLQYLINVYFFTDPLFSLENVLLIYRPMTLGMTLLLISFILHLHLQHRLYLTSGFFYSFTVILFICGTIFTYIQTPWERGKGLLSPIEIEKLAVQIGEDIKDGRLNILYYSHLNPNILDYYRIKNNLTPIDKVYPNPGYDAMWSASNHSEENKKSTRATIKIILQEASMVIIPENLKMYKTGPYAFYKFADDWTSLFEEPDVPKFMVVNKIQDIHGVLLVLMPEDLAPKNSSPMQLPWGSR